MIATITSTANDLPSDYCRLCAPLLDDVYVFIRAQIPVAQDAEDITQDVFRKALQHWQKIQTGDPRGWIFTTARNAISQYYRDRNVERKSMQTLKGLVRPREHTQEGALETRLAYEAAQTAIAQLEPQEREAIRLKFSSALSNGDIAQMLNLSPNHFGVVLYRALKKVRSELEKQGYEHA